MPLLSLWFSFIKDDLLEYNSIKFLGLNHAITGYSL